MPFKDKEYPIEDAYINLHLVKNNFRSSLEELCEIEKLKSLSSKAIKYLLNRETKILISRDGGAGKTTLGQYITYCWASDIFLNNVSARRITSFASKNISGSYAAVN